MKRKLNKSERVIIMIAVNTIVAMLAKLHGRIIDNDKKNCCAIASSEELDNLHSNATTMSALIATRIGIKPKELIQSVMLANDYLSDSSDDDDDDMMTPPDFKDMDIITPN